MKKSYLKQISNTGALLDAAANICTNTKKTIGLRPYCNRYSMLKKGEGKRRVQAAFFGWRKVSAFIGDTRAPENLKSMSIGSEASDSVC